MASNDDAAAVVVVDAYTHYAPKALAQYLEECSGKPLVFAKVSPWIGLGGLGDCCWHLAGADWAGGVDGMVDRSINQLIQSIPLCQQRLTPPPQHTHTHKPTKKQLFERIPLLTDIPQRLAFLDARGVKAHVLVPLPWLETVPDVHRDKERSVRAFLWLYICGVRH
jgi:hypothetical protein